ncbi:MAG: hypothetical protein IH945_07980 [Armatimonadetes bacterium]|nr:hypothetical protein [Armatimonadota bacterium]
MPDQDLIERYNYDSFTREKFGPWMRFEESPDLGQPATDHPLLRIDEIETSLKEEWRRHKYLVVEFGSFT